MIFQSGYNIIWSLPYGKINIFYYFYINKEDAQFLFEELVEEGGGVRFQRSTDNILLNNMMIGGRPCLLGLLHPRLQLPQPDHTEQRAGLPHCQGGASQQQQQQRHISNNYPHHKLQKRITQSSE